ncbi:sensor histidine kinase [Cellulomonas dongxiuzhuiae]|uniref:sensor histidine kinase n=1 Tax=Cellulomonas dongxiuzhuiae TaxID=2819979 RepID=UPI001AAF979D|nr:histidine kinase [Cellulomonas dongxiuzhuiae]MBO3089171.1 hypothetical protein [Cellulomonas dongxiuzhuiae]
MRAISLAKVWDRRRPPPGGAVRAGVLAAVVVAAVVVVTPHVAAVQDGVREMDPLGWLLALASTACLAWWTRYPVAVLATSTSALAAYLWLGYPYGPAQAGVVLAMYGVGRRVPLAGSSAACAASGAVIAAAVLPRLAADDAVVLAVLAVAAWTGTWVVVPWALGALGRARSRAADLERERQITAAVDEERMRLARDVHDVAGHGFAVVAMQAGVALVCLEDDPGQARLSLEAIRTASTSGLAELRATLGTFHRAGEPGPPQRAGADGAIVRHPPADDIRPLSVRLRDLVDVMRTEGAVVVLHVDPRVDLDVGTPGGAGAVADVVHRVVQEALTNVLRHAGPVPATVSVTVEARDAVIEVANPAPGGHRPSGGPRDGGRTGTGTGAGGTGIHGMRHRVEELGGELHAGPTVDGGFAVTARVPRESGRRSAPVGRP